MARLVACAMVPLCLAVMLLAGMSSPAPAPRSLPSADGSRPRPLRPGPSSPSPLDDIACRPRSAGARAGFTEGRDLVRGADLAVATREAPLSGNHNVWCDSRMRFVGNESYAASLADAGFDVLSLAANHIGDGGTKGVIDTVAALDRSGVAHAGAGANESAARKPAITQVGRLRVAMLAYNDVTP